MLWLVASHVETKTSSWFECFETDRACYTKVFQVVCFNMIFKVGWKPRSLSTLHTLPNRGVVHINSFGHERLNQSFDVCSETWVMVWQLICGLSFHCLCVVRMWKDNLPRDLKGLKQRWHSNCSPWICVASMWSFRFVQTFEILPHSMHWYMEAPVSSVVFERKDWTILSMAKSEHVEVLYQRSAAIYTEVLHIWLNMAYFDMAAFVLNVVFYRDVGSKSVAWSNSQGTIRAGETQTSDMRALNVIFQVISFLESLWAFSAMPWLGGVTLPIKSNQRRNQGLQF